MTKSKKIPSNNDVLDSLTKVLEPTLEEKAERIEEALKSPTGLKLALRLKRKDDSTYIVYQGLLENAWGRFTKDKMIIYNARLGRLLAAHPATKDLPQNG